MLQGERFGSFFRPFYRKFINCLLKYCRKYEGKQPREPGNEAGRKGPNLSTKSCSDISELEDNYRNCSECKKLLEAKTLLEIQEVAKKLPSNLWKALTSANCKSQLQKFVPN